MSFFMFTLNDKIHHGLEKALIYIESLHLKVLTKPYDLLEKSEALLPITQPLRSMTEGIISKSYRGVRDLNEMSHQVYGNVLSAVGLKH